MIGVTIYDPFITRVYLTKSIYIAPLTTRNQLAIGKLLHWHLAAVPSPKLLFWNSCNYSPPPTPSF